VREVVVVCLLGLFAEFRAAEVEVEGLFPKAGEDDFPLGVAEAGEAWGEEVPPCEKKWLGRSLAPPLLKRRLGRSLAPPFLMRRLGCSLAAPFFRRGVDGVVEGGVRGITAAEFADEGKNDAGVVDILGELGQRGVGVGFLAEGKLSAGGFVDTLEQIAEFLDKRAELSGDAGEKDGARIGAAHAPEPLALQRQRRKGKKKPHAFLGKTPA
jgi:hypothetical protein